MSRHGSGLPDFLALPPARAKPRPARLTHVLDKGIAPGDLRVLLARFAEHVDIWKMGWGTAYLDPDLAEECLAWFSPEDWAQEMLGDVESGATWVITEGRAKGSVGLFSAEGHVREEEAGRLVALAARKVGIDRVVFKAPRKNQQAWLINLLGADISLGNVPPGDVFALETLRRGLRADTIHLFTRARAESSGEMGAGR